MRALLAIAAAALSQAVYAAVDVSAIDRSIDPCADFYGYANQRWLEATRIPPDRARWGSFDLVDRNAEEILVRAIGQALAGPAPPEGSAKRQILDYYASGMDEAQERPLPAVLSADLDRAAGLDGPASLARLLAGLQARGIDPGFTFDVDPDPKESSRYLAAIAQGGLGLPDRDYYFLEDARSQAIREAYRKHVASVLALEGASPERAAEDAGRVFALETELARASMTRVERRNVDKTYNVTTPAQLEQAAPGFPWRTYFAALGAPALERLNVRQPAYLARFAQLAAERPAADWRAYVRWHILRATADKLDARHESLHFDFYARTLEGRQEPAPRARRVLDVIAGRYGEQPMAEAVGQVYVDAAFTPQAKARMLALARNVKEALRERLKAVDWMSEETRERSLQKLDAMKIKVGYPDRWKDFSRADVGRHSFVENWMNAHRFAHERDVARIGRPVDREEWRTSPHTVNAFYRASNNEIVLPAAILQPPFFDPRADDAANYGGIGMVIGHEITHGFDDRGRRFDKDGNLRDWWSDEDARRYKERARRIEAQYGNFTGIDGIKVNGALTLGENISDIGGTKIAHLALDKAIAGAPPGNLEGFTPEQRFFLSFANIWRAVQRPEQERLRLRTDGHSLPRLRVRGVVANMPEFARAFSCDAAKALLPEPERANIW